MISFHNPGELDIRLATLFGANVKETENPIGFFGTGLKYAIAGVLRLRGKIEINAGTTLYNFETQPEMIRNKPFDVIFLHSRGTTPQRLGFTLELGKTWLPWMLYRELYSNVLDEGGGVTLGSMPAQAGRTVIRIQCKELEEVHTERGKYFLQSDPVHALRGVSLHQGATKSIYYQGIRVGEWERPALFSYNFTRKIALTEDRTVRNPYDLIRELAYSVIECENPRLISQILLAPEGTFEHKMDFDWHAAAASEIFLSTMTKLVDECFSKINPTAVRLYNRLTKKDSSPTALVPDPIQQKTIDRACAFLADLGFKVQEPIVVTESLSDDTLGMAHDEKIYLAVRAFDHGTKYIAATILEEHLHIRRGFLDCTREMQNFLFERLMTIGERLRGEPL